MLLGPLYSPHTVTLERARELVLETGYSPIVTEDGAVLASFLNPRNPDFYRDPSLCNAKLIATQDGVDYRLTVAAIHFLANAMKNADSE